MKRFGKLVHFEFNRFFKIYLVLIGITILSQIIGIIVESTNYINLANKSMYEDHVSLKQFIEENGMMSFAHIGPSLWLLAPIAIVAVSLLFYMIFIWYRDWLGKNTFIYRLLMLPTNRISVFAAKATTILLYTFGMIAIQLVLFQVDAQLLKWIVPDEFRFDMTTREMIQTFDFIGLVFPYSFTEFIIHYGLGMIVVSVVFTMILLERSFRLKGILFAVLYGAAAVLVFILPILLNYLVFNEYLYPGELIIAEIITAFIVLVSSIWTSHYLLNKKIRV
ncbi:hypothetical protein OEV98_15445 [Caldibacillus lycopersici]|uniref:Uncharacterized protein n=1 Tax=Perspicuibacillus lycopersici TaxID=1325689 RepID=A0AAE3IXW0_9BACI|nr:hypothetical protein [Perspicuibacillus lycopersici]MCU9614939.1 hypothetical protein [Perspicuibacillus lycopersici]